MIALQLAPNLEILLYLAQATGSFLLTDSFQRWEEIKRCQHREGGIVTSALAGLANAAGSVPHGLVLETNTAVATRQAGQLGAYRRFIGELHRTLIGNAAEVTPERSSALVGGFRRVHEAAQREFAASGHELHKCQLQFLVPKGGIHHDNVHRLLTTGIEKYLPGVPMAVLIDMSDDADLE